MKGSETSEIIPTHWCSVCKKTSVAERDAEGTIHCPHCEEANREDQ